MKLPKLGAAGPLEARLTGLQKARAITSSKNTLDYLC